VLGHTVKIVENGAARHTPTRYFLCSDSLRERACLWLWICAEDSGIWLRHWAFGLYVWESIANAGMRDNFGIVQLSGKAGEKAGEKQKHCKASL